MFIDFSELSAEDLEFLVADLLEDLGYTIVSRPARGPDRGKDLIASCHRKTNSGFQEKDVILVECKHFFKSGKSVREDDIGNFESKAKIHKANKYLLVTTSVVSETVKNQFEAVAIDSSSRLNTAFWSKNDLLERIRSNVRVYEKYFTSWEKEVRESVMYAKSHLFSAHRGAFLWMDSVTAVFGNDGYSSAEVTLCVDMLRKRAAKEGYLELAFMVDDEEYTWVVLYKTSEARLFFDYIWEIASITCPSGTSHQKSIAFEKVVSYFSSPHKKG